MRGLVMAATSSPKTKSPPAHSAPAGRWVQLFSFQLATPPRARIHVMVMAMMRPQQFHDDPKLW